MFLLLIKSGISVFQSRPSLTQIITMKKPAAAAPIKIVINQTKGISQVISNSSSSSSKKEETVQPQRSDSASSSATVPLEPQVVLEEGGRAVAQGGNSKA